MADWVTISSLATAGGTLVLAVATFSSVKSGSRSARIAERSLLAGLRPLLIPSREDDPVEYVRFGDGQVLNVPGHGGAVLQSEENIYMAIALRNGGSGLAVLHAWRAEPRETVQTGLGAPDPDSFQRQQLDLYIPAGDTGFWQGRLRDPSTPNFERVRDALSDGIPLQVDLVYGDHEGGNRTITRFLLAPWSDVNGESAEGKRVSVLRYWYPDRDDPR